MFREMWLIVLADDIRQSRSVKSSPPSLFDQRRPDPASFLSSRIHGGRYEQLRWSSTQSDEQVEYDPEAVPFTPRETRDVERPSQKTFETTSARRFGKVAYDRNVLKSTRTYHLKGAKQQQREQRNQQRWQQRLQNKSGKELEGPVPFLGSSNYDTMSKKEKHAARHKYEAAKRSKANSIDLDDILDEAIEQHYSESGASNQPHSNTAKHSDHGKNVENWSTRTFQTGRSPTSSSLVRYHVTYRPGETAASLPPLDGAEKVQDRKTRSTSIAAVANPETKSTEEFTSERPSERLYIAIPESGEYRIDNDLTIDFDAVTPLLTQYIQQMQNRLKNQHPRMDDLPYEVWSTRNRKTLINWLKVLIIRWQVRHLTSSNQQERDEVTDQVKLVLDQMVREHDLDNEAANRMAKRFRELFSKKLHVLSEESVNEDELEIDGMEPGMGFLQDQTDEPEPDAPLNHDTRSTNSSTVDKPQFGVLTKRLYSTSSRPPAYQNDPLSPTQTSPEDRSRVPLPTPIISQGPKLPHLTPTGSAHMVSVSAKLYTVRTAIAVGTVHFSNDIPFSLIQSNSIKKGDVLSVSRIAGIMAAKKCPDLIPLCHPIQLTHVGVELRTFAPDTSKLPSLDGPAPIQDNMSFGGVQIEAKVECTGPTGVEMEALTSVMGAALSVVDMCKAVDKFQRIGDVRVVLKEGGKSGIWREEGWRSWQ